MNPVVILKISDSVWFESWQYESIENDVSINYKNVSPAHGFSDEEKEVKISREQAAKIIGFLRDAFNEEKK